MGRPKKSPKIQSPAGPGNAVTTPAILQEYEQQRKFFGKKEKPKAAFARREFGLGVLFGAFGAVALAAVLYSASKGFDSSFSSPVGAYSENFRSSRGAYFDTLQESCVQDWNQCGGQNFGGPSSCCNAPKTVCSKQNEWYSQCIPEGYPTFPPLPTVTTTAGCVADWSQCGGINYPASAPTCCEHSDFECVKQDDWYSQCIRKATSPTPSPTPSPTVQCVTISPTPSPTPRPTPSPTAGADAFYDFENADEIISNGILRAFPNSAYDAVAVKMGAASAVPGKDGNTVNFTGYYTLGSTADLGPDGFSLSFFYKYPYTIFQRDFQIVKAGGQDTSFTVQIRNGLSSGGGSQVLFGIGLDQNCKSDDFGFYVASADPSYDQWVELKASYIPPQVGSTEVTIKLSLNGVLVQKSFNCLNENGGMIRTNDNLVISDTISLPPPATLIDSFRLWNSAVDIF